MKKWIVLIWIAFLPWTGCRAPSEVELPTSASGAYHLVDLSQILDKKTAVYPGGVTFALESITEMDQGYYMNRFSMGEHTGTHLDAPAHFAEGQLFVDEIPVESFVCPAVVIDVSNKVRKNPDYLLTVEDIKAWEEAHETIPEKAVVIMKTGWEIRAGKAEEYRNADSAGTLHFPGFSQECAAFLVNERDINGIGIDTLSLDYGPSKDFPVHRTVLSAGKYQIENLQNLDNLPPLGAMLIVCPLKIRRGSGAPARVLALIPAG